VRAPAGREPAQRHLCAHGVYCGGDAHRPAGRDLPGGRSTHIRSVLNLKLMSKRVIGRTIE
jgi:hypothetical protein